MGGGGDIVTPPHLETTGRSPFGEPTRPSNTLHNPILLMTEQNMQLMGMYRIEQLNYAPSHRKSELMDTDELQELVNAASSDQPKPSAKRAKPTSAYDNLVSNAAWQRALRRQSIEVQSA